MIETAKTLLTFWEPEQGPVSSSLLILQVEMTGRSTSTPWLPGGCCFLIADDGASWWFIYASDLPAFLTAHLGCDLVFHEAAPQLDVMNAAAPNFDIYQFVERDQVWDTHLLQRLLLLGTVGETGPAMALNPVDCISELGSDGTLEQVLQFADDDADWALEMRKTRAIYRLFGLQLDEFSIIESAATEAFGFVDEGWYRGMTERFGPQTHHIQLRASIVLQTVTRAGLLFESGRTSELRKILSKQVQAAVTRLLTYGYSPLGKTANQVLQRVLRRLERQLETRLERTAKGDISTSEESLCQYRDHEFVEALLEYRSLSSCIQLIPFLYEAFPTDLHATFDVLKRTGRTSSFGEVNAQNFPRDPNFRRCIVPHRGQVFVDADYASIELVTLAAALEGQFGQASEMARLLREGHDLHRCLASCIADVDIDQVTDVERQKAKAINFGKPGGMGVRTLRRYAKVQYGLDLTEDEARDLSELWHNVFPETRQFLFFDTAYELAYLLDLTPYSYQMAIDGPERTMDTVGNRQPCAWLGAMCLTVLGVTTPMRKDGRPYTPTEISYFWSKLNWGLMELPESVREKIKRREPAWESSQTMRGWLGTGGVITWTGRLRANAAYCAKRNTIFQGLAADGAKLAMWKLWRAGFRIVNFIHDEFLIEIPIGADIEAQKLRIQSLMQEGMRGVLPMPLPVDIKIRHGDSWAA